MAKKKDNAPGKLREQAREQLAELGYEKLIEDFQLFDPFGDGSMDATADLVAMDGDEPVVLFAAADPGDAARPSIQDDAKFKAGLGADEGKPFRFVWVWDGDNNFIFDLEKDAQISDLPRKDLWREIAKPISDSRSRLLQDLSAEYHRGDFRAIQRKFDQLHDAIYSRGGVKLKDAFREINNLPQYKAKDITGEEHTIFAYDEPLKLENTDILAMAIDSMDLRDRDGQTIRLSVPDKELVGNGEQARMMRAHLIHEDLLGWAFDVFLRGKYASNEGLATYLTPSQVVECMSHMVFHDITDAELWARRGDKDQQERWSPGKDEKDLPAFLCGDICCGTGRFLVGALREIKKRILDDKHVGHSDDDKLAWLSQMKRHSFFGADQAEGSIQKARINMLLYGEDHSQLLKVDDSITDTHVDKLVGKFDLILTNPPFGAGKYDDPKGLAKMRKEELELELGWKWKAGDRSKKKAIDKADPAALFVDRNLQLLKPGGRLLIVVPDGILCNSGDAYIREYIMGSKDEETGEFLGGKAILKAVVSLPTETFAISGTGAKTSFIYVQKKKHASEKQGPVFMGVAEHVGYLKKGKTEIPDPAGNDLVTIADIYTRGEQLSV